MLLAHFILTNYRNGYDHPIASAILHWLTCLALNVGMWLAFFLVVFFLFAITN